MTITYKGQPLRQQYVPDFIVYDNIIVEIKAVTQLGPNEEAQLLNYLRASDATVGLLINFGASRKLEWKRMVYSRRARSARGEEKRR